MTTQIEQIEVLNYEKQDTDSDNIILPTFHNYKTRKYFF